MAKYNTALLVAIGVDHDYDDPEQLLRTEAGRNLLLSALTRRLVDLSNNPEEVAEAFEVWDTGPAVQETQA